MWVLEGLFDGIEDGPPQRKLLKPGKTYTIGRKAPADIIIAGKVVSREAATITVAGPASTAITDNPNAQPAVTVRPVAKPLRVIDARDCERFRAEEGFIGRQIEQGGETTITDGDLVVLARTVPASKLVWVPMAWCLDRRRFKEPELGQYVAQAAELGIPVARDKNVPSTGWTHWVTAATGFTPSTLLAVCRASWIVTKDYLDEVLRLGALDAADPASLEAAFVLPDEATFMPPLTTVLDATITPEAFAQRIQPDRLRPTLFKGTTMVMVHDPRLKGDAFLHAASDLARASGASVEECDVTQVQLDSQANVARYLRPILGRATSALAAAGDEAMNAPDGGLVVLVVQASECRDEPWHHQLASCTRELDIRMPDEGTPAIAQSVIHAAPRLFLNKLASILPTDGDMGQGGAAAAGGAEEAPAQPTPGFLPAASGLTANGEPAPPPTASTVLPTQAAQSAAPAEVPAQEQGVEETPAAPKPLRRRTAAASRRDPLDDLFGGSSSAAPAASGLSTSASAAQEKSPLADSQLSSSDDPASGLQPRTLKRRARTARAEDAWDALLGGGGGGAESASNAYASGTQGFASKSAKYRQELEEADARAQTQQNATQAQHESSENTAGDAGGQPQQQKRRARIEEDAGDTEAPPSKRGRTAEPEEAAPPASNSSVGPTPRPAVVREDAPRNADAPAQIGKDAKFLQALATQRKSKKADNFDREFDKLHIAVGGGGKRGGKGSTATAAATTLDDEDDQGYMLFRDMAIDDLDLDSRQGFIQVDFVSLVRKDKGGGAATVAESNDARPNFKKFRKVRTNAGAAPAAAARDRRTITLDLAEAGDDFGLGGEGDATVRAPRIKVALDDDEGGGDETVELMAPPPRGGQRSVFAELSDSEGDEFGGSTAVKGGKKGAAAASRARSAKKVTPPARGRKASTPASSRAVDDDEDDDVDLHLDGDDDDDDDFGISSRRGKGRSVSAATKRGAAARGAKRTASAMMDLDEEDEDGEDSFAGVGGVGRGGSKARRTAKKTPAADEDDDDGMDDDGDFAGFGVTRTPSRRAARAKKGRI